MEFQEKGSLLDVKLEEMEKKEQGGRLDFRDVVYVRKRLSDQSGLLFWSWRNIAIDIFSKRLFPIPSGPLLIHLVHHIKRIKQLRIQHTRTAPENRSVKPIDFQPRSIRSFFMVPGGLLLHRSVTNKPQRFSTCSYISFAGIHMCAW